MPHSMSKCIFLAPAPRIASDIFDENDLFRLRAIGDVVIHEVGPVTDGIFEDRAAKAEIIIGQIDLPESRLKRATSLRAVFNVEGNFLPNIDYAYCFRHGIRVLNTSPVFAEPVAEAALGMAIDLPAASPGQIAISARVPSSTGWPRTSRRSLSSGRR
jgi:phosphoglycerate dehydrogenase-like enzyme